MFLTRARLASTLLALGWVTGALSGCLLSQEDRVLNIPGQKNRPPRIMEELPITPENRLIDVGLAPDPCPELRFSFSAEDPDVNDPLTVRWYVDYQRTRAIADERFLAVSGRPQRDEQGVLTVNLASALPPPLNQLQLSGVHIVEAVLFDFRLAADRTPVPISGADGGILNPSYAVSYAWTVNASRPCPP